VNKKSKGLPHSRRAAAVPWITALQLVSGLSLLCAPLLAAEPAAQLDELDEVLIDGRRPSRKPSEIITWMRRLVGTFTYAGHVDLHGKGEPEDLRPVTGRSDCVGFGPAPAVQCEIRITWPETKGPNGEAVMGGMSALNPAMMLYGFEPDDLGIRYMIVDSKGIAEPALGLLVGDTLTSKEPCVNTPGTCQKITKITAEPDGTLIEMQIDIERDYKRAMSYRFVLHRVGKPQYDNPVQVSP
jgi:hypothetical protein